MGPLVLEWLSPSKTSVTSGCSLSNELEKPPPGAAVRPPEVLVTSRGVPAKTVVQIPPGAFPPLPDFCEWPPLPEWISFSKQAIRTSAAAFPGSSLSNELEQPTLPPGASVRPPEHAPPNCPQLASPCGPAEASNAQQHHHLHRRPGDNSKTGKSSSSRASSSEVKV